MDATVWWLLINVVTLVGTVLIGLRRWHGWALFTVANLGWIAYSAVYEQTAVSLVVNLVFVIVSAYFTYTWRKALPATSGIEHGRTH